MGGQPNKPWHKPETILGNLRQGIKLLSYRQTENGRIRLMDRAAQIFNTVQAWHGERMMTTNTLYRYPFGTKYNPLKRENTPCHRFPNHN